MYPQDTAIEVKPGFAVLYSEIREFLWDWAGYSPLQSERFRATPDLNRFYNGQYAEAMIKNGFWVRRPENRSSSFGSLFPLPRNFSPIKVVYNKWLWGGTQFHFMRRLMERDHEPGFEAGNDNWNAIRRDELYGRVFVGVVFYNRVGLETYDSQLL